MEKERLNRLIVMLYETREPELTKLAVQLGDEKFQKGLRKPLLDRKMEKLLEYLLDPQSNYYIREANSRIRRTRTKLLHTTGWYASRTGVTNINLALKTIDYFMGTTVEIKPYHLDRDETGYHVQTNPVKKGSIYEFVRNQEEEFYENNQKELTVLHNSFQELERIMGGEYGVDRQYRDLAELVCEYFGYQKTPEIEKKK